MTRLLQICITFAFVQWIGLVNGAPFLQGISIRKNFDISLRPMQLKPITFTREKWGPWGRFGRRHSITKREAESVIGPKSVIPIGPKAENSVLSSPVIATSPSTLNTEIILPPSSLAPITSVIPARIVSPAPVYEDVSEGPHFLTHPDHANSASSTLISNIIPHQPPIKNTFFHPSSTLRPVTITSYNKPGHPIISIPTVITPSPPIKIIPPKLLNTDITQSIPDNPYLKVIKNPGPVYDEPTKVKLIVPNNDQTELVNPNLPPAARRGILVRFGEFFLQLLTGFLNAARVNRSNLPPQ